MNIFQRIFNRIEPTAEVVYWSGTNIVPFDGEKTPMELGSPLQYEVNYYALRERAWASFLDTDVVQNAIKKYVLWVVGSGLKLQSDPVERILSKNKISIKNLTEFQKDAEENFRLFAKIKESTYQENESLHSLMRESLKTALLSGDILCINRFENGKATLETIDGYYVQSPVGNDNLPQGNNTIIQGVELNNKGKHVAYWVVKEGYGNYERIEAKSKDGKITFAWLFYGMKYKNGDVRGVSLLSAVLETAAKMDRYKDAAVGSAEENEKIPYTIEHGQHSTGENPMIKKLANTISGGQGKAVETDLECNQLADKVAISTSKQVYNLPNDATLKRNAGTTDINFPEFYGVNVDIIYATLGIPPEIAMDKFGGAYSGSRAALKSWEYKMMTDRNNLCKDQFYKPFYTFWLNIEILQNRIQAEGYLLAYSQNNFMVLEAYRNCRFIGATVPHIDPLKEITAERKKLGSQFDTVPLTTAEQSCEALNTGDFNAVVQKAEVEKELAGAFDEIVEEIIIDNE